MLTGHIITPRLIIANEAALSRMDAKDRSILEESIAEATVWQDAELSSQEQALVKSLTDGGMTLIEPDVASFRDPVLASVPALFEEKWGKGTWAALAAL